MSFLNFDRRPIAMKKLEHGYEATIDSVNVTKTSFAYERIGFLFAVGTSGSSRLRDLPCSKNAKRERRRNSVGVLALTRDRTTGQVLVGLGRLISFQNNVARDRRVAKNSVANAMFENFHDPEYRTETVKRV